VEKHAAQSAVVAQRAWVLAKDACVLYHYFSSAVRLFTYCSCCWVARLIFLDYVVFVCDVMFYRLDICVMEVQKRVRVLLWLIG